MFVVIIYRLTVGLRFEPREVTAEGGVSRKMIRNTVVNAIGYEYSSAQLIYNKLGRSVSRKTGATFHNNTGQMESTVYPISYSVHCKVQDDS